MNARHVPTEPPRPEVESSDSKPNRQRVRSELSTARLLAAAAELFADRGYRQTTLADIGERAGYSHGLVTRRFGSKQGLIVALLDYMIDNWKQRALLPAVGGRTGIAGIRAFFASFCANAQRNSTNLRALESLMFEGLWGEAELQERLAAVERDGQKLCRDLIDAGRLDGTVRPDVEVEAVALMMTSALRGATYRWLLDDDFDLCATLTAFGDVLETLLRPDD